MRRGDRVQPSGWGRTARWHRDLGATVLRVARGSVFVLWDETTFEDEMDPRELVPAEEARR
jgi:hypothetical protein